MVSEPDPIWELTMSVYRIRTPSAARYRPWAAHVRERVAVTPGLRDALGLLGTLIPVRGDFPDFLTPSGAPGHDGFDGTLDLIGATPRDRVRAELTAAFRGRPAPAWVRRLAAGDRECRRELHATLRLYHRELVRPMASVVSEAFLDQRARHGESLLQGGVAELLGTLSPVARWDPPVLTVEWYPMDRDLHLAGRGVTLVPSYFCQRNPVTLIDPGLPPVLVYPIHGRLAPSSGDLSGDRYDPAGVLPGLAGLLGQTRALALTVLDPPCSTSELARRMEVSAATASRHATVLRAAGLVHSTRYGNVMIHRVTAKGRTLMGA